MRIGILLRTWRELGGIGTYSRCLVEALLGLDAPHQYVLFYSDLHHLGRFRDHPNVEEVYVPGRNRWLWDQVAAPRAARHARVDVLLHTKFAVPLLAHCPTAMVLHGSERFVYPEFSHRSDVAFFRTVYPFYLRRASLIVSVSENARRDVIRFLGIEPGKIVTIPLAPSPVFAARDDPARDAAVQARYGLPSRFFLHVGLLYPGKNVPTLLRAFRRVRCDVDVRLVLAGAGKRMYAGDLRLLRDLGLEGEVVLPGYVPHEDLAALYRGALGFVFPSFYESFPLAPLEAMASGCPVIISRTGGAPEVAGAAALYVDPRDEAGLAEAMRRVAVDEALRRDLSARGLAHAARFSWSRTARATLEAVVEVARADETAHHSGPTGLHPLRPRGAGH